MMLKLERNIHIGERKERDLLSLEVLAAIFGSMMKHLGLHSSFVFNGETPWTMIDLLSFLAEIFFPPNFVENIV